MKKLGNVILILTIIITLSGCTSINEVDQEKVKEVSEKITEALIDTVGNEKVERLESHTINADKINTLNIKSSVGSINIVSHDSNEAIINLTITSQGKSKENSTQLVENFTYSIEEKFNSLNIDTTYNDKILEGDNVAANLDISLPKNIDKFIISLNVGDIKVENVDGKFEVVNNVGEISISNSQGSYNLKTNVGDIILSSILGDKKSEITTNTGDINASFNNIENTSHIKATTDVGDIEISVPENSGYEAILRGFMEEEKTISQGNKNTEISIKTGVGEIKFN